MPGPYFDFDIKKNIQHMALRRLDLLERWYEYFVSNASARSDIPWEIEENITGQERRCIKDSIATFQIGEYSEDED